jgi:hypothetical protein
MPVDKQGQMTDVSATDDVGMVGTVPIEGPLEDYPLDANPAADDNDLAMGPGKEMVVLEVGDEDGPKDDIVFMLPDVPGAPGAGEIEVKDDDEIGGDIEVEDDEVEVEHDPWDWASKGMGGFLNWLKGMMDGVPMHSGYDSTGLEKAVAYFELLDKEITKAMRQDFKDEINSAQAERAREQIENGIERMIERLERVKASKYKRHAKKSKKKSWAESFGLVKEAQGKATNISGITVTVPLLISAVARVCINGMVSAGHDLEDLYASQVKEYSLDKREQTELAQLLSDMGYAMRRDRGFVPGTKVNITDTDNRDWATNFYG